MPKSLRSVKCLNSEVNIHKNQKKERTKKEKEKRIGDILVLTCKDKEQEIDVTTST